MGTLQRHDGRNERVHRAFSTAVTGIGTICFEKPPYLNYMFCVSGDSVIHFSSLSRVASWGKCWICQPLFLKTSFICSRKNNWIESFFFKTGCQLLHFNLVSKTCGSTLRQCSIHYRLTSQFLSPPFFLSGRVPDLI